MGRGPSHSHSRRRKINPYFFKVLLSDFANHLRVPPFFTKNFKGGRPNQIYLRSRHVKSSLSWGVNIVKKGDGCYITDGWNRISLELDLKYGDALFFELVSKDALEVVVCDHTGCDKKFDIECEERREPAEKRPKEAKVEIKERKKPAEKLPKKATVEIKERKKPAEKRPKQAKVEIEECKEPAEKRPKKAKVKIEDEEEEKNIEDSDSESEKNIEDSDSESEQNTETSDSEYHGEEDDEDEEEDDEDDEDDDEFCDTDSSD